MDTIAVIYGYEKIEILENANPTYLIDNLKTLEEIIEYKHG